MKPEEIIKHVTPPNALKWLVVILAYVLAILLVIQVVLWMGRPHSSAPIEITTTITETETTTTP